MISQTKLHLSSQGQSLRGTKLREKLNKILAKNTGQLLEKIEKDVERDFFMDADEAKKYGIIDEIMKKK